MTEPRQLPVALLGSPVAHSKSPLLHRAFYAELGEVERVYTAIDLPVEDFENFWHNERRAAWAGFSVTMPLKSVAAAAVSSLHGAARVLGVVNTIVFDGQISHGYNTDVTGLTRILRNLPSVGVEASRAVVLGSGASAASALLSLRDVGVEHVTIIARNMKSASLLAHDFNRLHIDVQPLPEQGADSQMIDTFHAASLVVSTLPQPVSAAIAESLEANQRFHNFTSRQAVIELGYGAASPSHSLSALAAGSGARAVDGLEFLIQQGVDQVLLHLGLTEPDSLADVDPGINELIDRLLAAGRRALQTD